MLFHEVMRCRDVISILGRNELLLSFCFYYFIVQMSEGMSGATKHFPFAISLSAEARADAVRSE